MGTAYQKQVEVRLYELTYLLPGVLSDQEVEKAKTETDSLLKKYQAEIIRVEDWGKKPLAYVMTYGGKKQTEATYTHIVFKLPANKAQELEREVQLSSKVMRHLLLAVEEPKEGEAKEAKEAKPEAEGK
jgi:small subunit ribosomal protein S6